MTVRIRLGSAAKRLFDTTFALAVLAVTSPLLLVAAIGIKLTSPGPVFYRARRVGRGGTSFFMLKLRTMHSGSDRQGAITAPGDCRVFSLGQLLRKLKIDELPQFWNILTGDLSIVGPRPEDPRIIARDYTDWMRETLEVRPGITGPGSVYGYIYGDALLDPVDPEGSYAQALLPPKLALERAYMERSTLLRDFGYILLTAWAIAAHVLKRPIQLPAADVRGARDWAPQGPYPGDNDNR